MKLHPISLQGLLIKVKADDDLTAFDTLFAHSYVQLSSIAARYLPSAEQASQAVIHIFAELWQHRKYIPIQEEVLPYLEKLVKKYCRNHTHTLPPIKDAIALSRDIALKSLHSRIDQNEEEGASQKERFRLGLPLMLLKAASLFMVIIPLYFFFKAQALTESVSPIYTELSFLQAAEVPPEGYALSDGSKVALQPQSALRYPQIFSERLREVYLEGSAYFSVNAHQKAPFIIHIGSAQIRCKDGLLWVKRLEETHELEVIVSEGVVAFQGQKGEKHTLLTSHQKLTYSLDAHTLERRRAAPHEEMAAYTPLGLR